MEAEQVVDERVADEDIEVIFILSKQRISQLMLFVFSFCV